MDFFYLCECDSMCILIIIFCWSICVQNVPEHVMRNRFKEFFFYYRDKKKNDGGKREETTPEKKKKYYLINMDKLISAVFFVCLSFACKKLNAFMPFNPIDFYTLKYILYKKALAAPSPNNAT